MFAKQSKCDSGMNNRIKKICVLGILCSICIIVGYIESLMNLSFIAPGVKLGLANSIVLFVLLSDNLFDAIFLNISRILLSALLFGSVVSFLFSFIAGFGSLIIMFFAFNFFKFGLVGGSVVGAVIHNILQIIVAYFITGNGIIFYIPILIISGVVSGIAVGFLCNLIFKKLEGSLWK